MIRIYPYIFFINFSEKTFAILEVVSLSKKMSDEFISLIFKGGECVDLIASSPFIIYKGEPQLTTIFSDKYENSNEREPAWLFPLRIPTIIMNVNLFFDTLLNPEHSETQEVYICDQFFSEDYKFYLNQ